ncbi:MAG: hypothetical protein ABIG45_01340 [Bacillota bacterium]
MLYLDDEYKAHAQQNEAGTLTPWADADGFFAGKCAAFIAGYRVVPEGETWTREDGAEFAGLMITPVENPAILQAAQAEADGQTIADLDAEVVELTYQNILLELAL